MEGENAYKEIQKCFSESYFLFIVVVICLMTITEYSFSGAFLSRVAALYMMCMRVFTFCAAWPGTEVFHFISNKPTVALALCVCSHIKTAVMSCYLATVPLAG